MSHRLVFVVLLAASSAQAGTVIHVDVTNCPGPGSGTVGDPYCSIQDAIDNAVDTDEIVVAPGTYFENINFLGKAITVRSSDGPGSTTIDGQGTGTVVTSIGGQGLDTVLDGFTITGGESSFGAGMAIASSGMTIKNCILENNHATQRGGALSNTSASGVSVIDCTFRNNTANSAGGAISTESGVLQVTRSTIVRNDAFLGGGIYGEAGAAIVLADSQMADNGPIFGRGGTAIFGGTDLVVDSCVISGHHFGGAMEGFGGSLTVTNSMYVSNYDAGGSVGGGIYTNGNHPAVIANCLFVENWTPGVGGGIGTASNGLAVVNSMFVRNRPAGISTFSPAVVTNGIFRNNFPEQLTGSVFFPDFQGSVSFSNVQGGFTGTGSNNIDANPAFIPSQLGTWTAGPVFDPVTAQTTFTDTNASFAPGELVRQVLRPDTTAIRRLPVFDNTATTITVLGDFASEAAAGDNYRLRIFHLSAGSPCIDAGDNDAVPVDITTDLEGNPRFQDDPSTPDTGNGTAPIVDMGAYEFVPCPWDCQDTPNGFVDIGDMFKLFGHWGSAGPCDFDGNGFGDINDLFEMFGNWGPCP